MESIEGKQLLAEVSAPGKLIVSGEHSVVYGMNALCAAIDWRCRCNLYKGGAPEGVIVFRLQNLARSVAIATKPLQELLLSAGFDSYANFLASIQEQPNDTNLYKYKVCTAVQAVRHQLNEGKLQQAIHGILTGGYFFNIESSIPVGKGLGSSAAISVCIAAALLCLLQEITGQLLYDDLALVNAIAFQYERIYHSNPSGVDNYVSCYGGLVLFNKNSKQYNRLQWPFSELRILLIDSKVEKNTKKAVDHVRQLCDQQNGMQTIQSISATTERILESFQRKEQAAFLQHVRQNHTLLRQLGLSNESIERIVEEQSTEHSSAKITGAGMGGYVVVFSRHPSADHQPTTISSTGLSIRLVH